MSLRTYQKRRDFKATPEPKGRKKAIRRARPKALSFVVQQHHATRAHFDFRLELDGVLRSWAVPKGPSLDPADKRLAVEVEDHPLEYGSFEGSIPAGQYGAGAVIVWDRGTWSPKEGDAATSLKKGSLKLTLHGRKLHGGWALVRMHTRDESHTNWLLIKEKDRYARKGADVVADEPASVKSGKTIEQIDNPRTRSVASAKKRPTRRHPGAPVSDDATVAGVRITHPERVVYPEIGLTKLHVARYYEQVADIFLPVALHRPLSLVRCPGGSGGKCFFHKHIDIDESVDLDAVPIRESDGMGTYAAITGLSGLIYLVQMNTLEFHAWQARTDRIERPDRLVFDLDPAPDVGWERVVEAARRVRAIFEQMDMRSFVMTSGGKGLHVIVPMDRRTEWEAAKGFARSVAEAMEAARPDDYVANMSKAKRKGRIFVDYLRVQRGATSILPYSTRARPGAPVAMPVEWEELEGLTPDAFTIESAPDHVRKRKRDPWKEVGHTRQTIPRKMLTRGRTTA